MTALCVVNVTINKYSIVVIYDFNCFNIYINIYIYIYIYIYILVCILYIFMLSIY